MITQAQFIREFNDRNREQFNDEIFKRDEDEIIAEIEKAILSCQRSQVFTIKVEKFTVVDDYDEIHRILYEYEERMRKDGEVNKMNYIPMKDSDIKLLIVDYFIAVYNEEDPEKSTAKHRVLIEVPRVVDKYYFYLFGNRYSCSYQILESTYNNSAVSSSKVSCVTLKTMFMASRIFRFNIDGSKEIKMKTTKGERINGVFYHSIIFKKSVQLMKYILARYGLYDFMNRIKVESLLVTDYDISDTDDNYYTVKRHNLFVSIPKFIFENDQCAQSLFYAVVTSISKDTTINDIFKREYWILELGEAYGSRTIEKGLSVLESFESIYDLSSKEHFHLPEKDKEDIYNIMIWLMREYKALRLKDNLDISMKRIRYADYIALLYAMKIVKGIIRISDKGAKVTVNQIIKAINTYPDYLLKQITRDSLINCCNNVNDLDSIIPLKYTYKGVSGLGEGGTSIPDQYRRIHKSHIGRIDLDAASATDPGLSGMLCPMGDIHGGSFSQESEPNTWREEVDELLEQYRELIGIKDLLAFRKELGFEENDRVLAIEDSMYTASNILGNIYDLESEEEAAIETVKAFSYIDSIGGTV